MSRDCVSCSPLTRTWRSNRSAHRCRRGRRRRWTTSPSRDSTARSTATAAGELTRVLLERGARADGPAGAGDSPLITAASYGELDMVRALLAAGADLESVGSAIPGGGTALAHAVFYGMPAIVDLLVGAGAVVRGVDQLAGVGRIPDAALRTAATDELPSALRAATVCERLDVIDQLLDHGLDVNVAIDGATALHWAAWQAKAASIGHLLERGADPTLRDDDHDMTAGEWYRYRRDQLLAINNPDCRRDADEIERALPAAPRR